MNIRKIALLNNTDYTISRPIVKTVVEDFKQSIIKNKDIFTYYLNNNTDTDFDSNDNVWNNAVNNSLLEVSYEKDTDSERALNNTVLRVNHYAIMLDKEIGYSVSPNTQYTKYILTLKYYDRNRNVLVRLLNYLKSAYSKDSLYQTHDVEYYYTIPDSVLALTKNIADIKGLNLYEYMESIALVELDFQKSRTNKYSIPVVREKQVSVISTLETDPYELKIDKDDNGYYVELPFRIDVEEPVSLMLEYPILVYNKPINDIFIPVTEIPKDAYTSSFYLKALGEIASNMRTYMDNNRPVIRIPLFDRWNIPEPSIEGMLPLVQFLLQIDENKPNELFNINDLISIMVNEKVVNYIKNRPGDHLFRIGRDIFLFKLYSNNEIADYDLYLDNDGIVKSKEPLDIKKQYHLVMYAIWDLNLLYNIDGKLEPLIPEYFDILKSIYLDPRENGGFTRYTVNILRIIAYTFNILDELDNKI